jgi:hypothetical protein
MDYKKMYEEQKEEYDKLKSTLIEKRVKNGVYKNGNDKYKIIYTNKEQDEENENLKSTFEENSKVIDSNVREITNLSEENDTLKETIKQLEFSLSATEEEKTPTTKLSDIVFDIKEKISDEDYKSYMESLQEINKKETTPKFVKLYHIKGYNNIHQHTDNFEYNFSRICNEYTWHGDDEDDECGEKVILKHLNINMVMKANTKIYEIVPYDELDGYFINPDKSQIRLNTNGELNEDIKVGNIINRGGRAYNTDDIFIIKELI